MKPILVAGVLTAVVTSPFLYYGLKGVPPLSPLVGDIYGGDALGFLVPTMLIRLGRQYFLAISATFSGANVSEAGTYLGLPLALIVARYTITRWRLISTRIMVITLAVIVVLLLGGHLYIAGHPTIPLPWKLLDRSVLRDVLPVRLALYMFLIVAIIVTMWLAQPRSGNWGVAKWVLAAASIAFLVPNISSGQWHWTLPNPAFFRTHEYRTYIRRGETVLVLPWGSNAMSMLWQAETGMWFRMTEGYLTPQPPPDYVADPYLSVLSGQYKPNVVGLENFLARRHVRAVIVDPDYPGQWTQALAALGLKPVAIGGILFYRV